MNIPSNVSLYINIGIAAIYLLFIFIGFKKGFLYELVAIIFTGVSIFAAYLLAPVFATKYPIIKLEEIYEKGALLSKSLNIDSFINSALYFVIIFFVLKLFYLVLTIIFKSFNKIPVIGKINRVLGGLFGIVNATLVTLLLSLILYLPIFKNGKDIRQTTVLKYIDTYGQKVFDFILEKADLVDINKLIESFNTDQARNDIEIWLSKHTDE